MVSIVLARTTKIDAVCGIIGKARKNFGNMRAAAYQWPGGWRLRSMQVFGIVELDVVALDDVVLPMAGGSTPNTSFSMIAPTGNTLWLPRVNLAVHHPHLDRAEFVRAVTHQWPGSERVIVRQFEEHQSAADNAAAVVGESLKRLGDGWSAHSRAEFHGWLFGVRRGLQPVGMSSRPPREEMPCNGSMKGYTAEFGWQDREIEPMPVLF